MEYALTPASPRRRTGRYVLLAVVLVGVAISVAVVLARRHPAQVELPPITDLDGAATYLRGPGAPLLALINTTSALVDGTTDVATCQTWASSALPAIGEPPALLALATAIPDQATAEMMMNDLDETMQALSACLHGNIEANDGLRFTSGILQRRLVQLGLA
jgi:hypothetical protein